MKHAKSTTLVTTFNGSLGIEGRGERLTADAGVVALREADERLGFSDWLADQLVDPRDPRLITHPLVELIRSRLYLMAQGRRDQDDCDQLRADAACRLAVSTRRGLRAIEDEGRSFAPKGLASQPTQSRLVEALSSSANLQTLSRAPFELARRSWHARRERKGRQHVIDVDSVAIAVHGEQDGSEYNGHYKTRCYHPLVTMLASTGDWLSAELRPGNVHTAEGATAHLTEVIERVEREIGGVASVRGDAGFPEEELLNSLEERRIGYAFRLKSNAVLSRMADPYMKRPPGRPPAEPRVWCHEMDYRAKSWSRERRVVLVVLERPGELFVDGFFLLTNWSQNQLSGTELLEFYRQRGTMESHLGELKSVLAPALSCTSRPKSHLRGKTPKKLSAPRNAEKANAATFLLFALAYNLTNTVRSLISTSRPRAGGGRWSLDSVRRDLLAVAGRIVTSGRRATLIVNAATAALWAQLWRALCSLRPVCELSLDSS
jgi:hypothetical protein